MCNTAVAVHMCGKLKSLFPLRLHVVLRGETPIVFLFFSPCNATQRNGQTQWKYGLKAKIFNFAHNPITFLH